MANTREFTAEQRAAILNEARTNAAGPRLKQAYAEPPVERATDKWRREAEEQLAAEQAAALSDSVGAKLVTMLYAKLDELRAEFEAKLQYEHRFILDVVKGALEEVHSDLLDEINAQVGQLRADMNIDKAFANAKVIDLPNPLPSRKAS
jgi:hypothetical protein